MTFKVIDTKTGKEPTERVVDNIAKKGGLMTMDIDQFFVGEDGEIVLADDCGNVTYVDGERFRVRVDDEYLKELNWYEPSVKEEVLRRKIAEEVKDKMYQMCVCLNVQESVLNIILDNNQPFESHCHRDCKNTTCDLWGEE